MSKTSAADEHREKMETMQHKMKAKMKAAQEKRGLIIVNTGNGKGKSTAAFGVLARTLAHGGKAMVVQFIKATADAAEKVLRGPQLTWHAVGGGFTWDTQDKAADIALCEKGWALAVSAMSDPELKLLVLDELNVVLSFNYLPLGAVSAALREKSPDLHVVITGRDAPDDLIELADLVSEIGELKHPFSRGVKAQAGLEF
ncbi:cob(I)yrinic acid a,c-diamide adenosyltransferase [Synoicihabitans lomoniglobus]|uniref:corrinoid adenosyltransferase n=1 Tax=Synoicihabitans lomoniglobus TaxID=2909285 RepID=A0AAE9ZW90_9BACT|nr:cob(I)yrinic acid a,c-diamide adenosyltransferase [Opitutaceae bacterium LMO-M01]WED65401.1 cob(I)yrinic acid a,c-diamide adenosyltransferase [Opitutaceae bacterium LMO-M01]